MDEDGNTQEVKSVFDSTPAEPIADVQYHEDGSETVLEMESIKSEPLSTEGQTIGWWEYEDE